MKKSTLHSLDTVQVHDIGKNEYSLPVTEDSDYIVDDSAFIPMSEAVKQLGLNHNFTGSDMKTAYDFPDGKDSGIPIPINRTKNGKDIAELSQSIAEQQETISNELQKQKEFEDYQEQVKASLDKSRPALE